MRAVFTIMLVAVAVLVSPAVSAEDPPVGIGGGAEIKNPYHKTTAWRIWREDASPVPNVNSLVRKDKKEVDTVITLAPTPVAKRIYPTGAPRDGEPIRWTTSPEPSAEFAGAWDDVYVSWSRLHGYVRPSWQTKDGSAVHLRPKGLDHFMHFVEMKPTGDLMRCGINFVHQSTTGMAHSITNAYQPPRTRAFEEIYFSNCLVTGPAHASFTETWPDRTADLYTALVPTLFNSVGSSNSETMAITKMIIAGGYMPPDAKKTLKRHGLYPGALLYMWKAALPFDVPYAHELRHRVAYRAMGRDDQFAGRYGHAGPERGNLAIEFHRYDEIAHMRNMIRIAMDMKTLPPEAILDSVTGSGGTGVYSLRKAALVYQEPGKEVRVRLSTTACYDLADRPVTVRFRLLYGNRDTRVTPADEAGVFIIHVPWDESLPEGRTAIAMIANNGVHDSNPAVINVYRKRGDLPPTGTGGKGGGYRYDSPHANRRPMFVDLQDRIVKPGEKIEMDLVAIDPEGQPVRFAKRSGEVGDLDGNRFTWTVPKDATGSFPVTFIASDATAGNSYAARRVNFEVAPAVHAHITTPGQFGVAPFTVEVSAEGSGAEGKAEYGWEFITPTPKGKPAAFDKLAKGKTQKHTFAKPGRYEVALTVRSGKTIDRQVIPIEVTKGQPPEPPSGLEIEGNGVRIRDGADRPSDFDHTRFGAAGEGERLSRTFTLINRFPKPLVLSAKSVAVTGKHASDFRVSRGVRKHVSAAGSATFDVEFRPRGAGTRTATIVVSAGGTKLRFSVSATGTIDQAKLDAAAEKAFVPAKKLYDERRWAAAEKALAAVVDAYPGTKRAEEAERLLTSIETDPEIKKERADAAKKAASADDLARQEKRAKSLFSMATSAAKNGRDDLARKYFQEIVTKYPDTSWAAKARERLK